MPLVVYHLRRGTHERLDSGTKINMNMQCVVGGVESNVNVRMGEKTKVRYIHNIYIYIVI